MSSGKHAGSETHAWRIARLSTGQLAPTRVSGHTCLLTRHATTTARGSTTRRRIEAPSCSLLSRLWGSTPCTIARTSPARREAGRVWRERPRLAARVYELLQGDRAHLRESLQLRRWPARTAALGQDQTPCRTLRRGQARHLRSPKTRTSPHSRHLRRETLQATRR